MQLLEKHFDIAFTAPDGMKKLRELILTLAMQGKLVPQDPNDQPASELLKKIETEKKLLAKDGKIKASKPLSPINLGGTPYQLPKGWVWTRLGTIGNIFNGNSINAQEKESKYTGVEGLPYIATKDVGYGFDELDYTNGIYIPETEKNFKIAHQGAVLICAEGGSAGKKCGISNRDICFGNKLFANELFGGIPSKFILYLYLSLEFKALFADAMTGIIGGISIANFLELPVPLPPLQEQRRIVAKIDQLLDRCDETEMLQAKRERTQLAAHTAATMQLVGISSENNLSKAWNFLSQNFGVFYSAKENVSELRKAILFLGINGKLVKQNPNDEPAALLLSRIFNERMELIGAGKLKKQRASKDSKPPDISVLPRNWANTTVGEVAHFITDGTHKTPVYVDSGIRFVSAKDIRSGRLSFDECKYITEAEHSELTKRCKPELGDILISKSGSIGTVVIVEDDGEFSLFESLALIKVSKQWLDNRYIYYALKSACHALEDHHIRGVAVKHLHLNVLRDLPILLPPLSEQNRIVNKIDRLVTLCDKLEQQIDTSTAKQTELLNAVMAQI